ncbi:serine proteinase stubble [Drosophila nasuta]|uniref:serine proteinase stubble n=1 Tax=Drosophila nasuta TaxID=42062 RepID=UPI00295E8AA5|nr:serine proteinase stubble [Drosophila nasuta]XP_060646664.1 serine proteinase stubble [Drosophila nasuta]
MKQATLIRHRHRTADPKMWPKQRWLVKRATAAIPARSTHQILEVLLALILVNGLASATAALITPPDSISSSSSNNNFEYDSSSSNEDDDSPSSLPSFYRSPHRLDGYYTPADLQRSHNYKISPKPCSFGRVEGTCMFVWECIKSEGQHVGMCVDSFMFGSCCAHNYTDNIVLPQTAFSYTRPTKPLSLRPRPPPQPHKPLISGMTTIERPHGAGTLVIRPSGPHHQGPLSRPHPKPTSPPDLHSAASQATASSNSIWHTSTNQQQAQHHHWHMTTEPSFITKPRPTGWTKPGIVNLPAPQRPSKPPKPTKKPIVYERPPPPSPQTPTPATSSTTMILFGQTKPKPKPKPTRPQLSPATSLAASSSSALPATSAAATTTKGSTTTTTTTTRRTTTTTTTTTRKPIKPYQRPTTVGTTTTMSTTTTTGAAASAGTTSTGRPSPSPNPSQRPTPQLPTRLPATSGIESNEITDSSTHDEAGNAATMLGTVRTISAARSECGVQMLTRPETRIVGGKSAAFGRWPWQVSVRRISFFGLSSTHRCGGALINENWIATAGHCVEDLVIKQIRIRVGEYDFSHVQEQLPYIECGVAERVVHPKYNFNSYEYDLAVVKLEQPLEFAPHISPICLPETDSLLIGMNATVTGWGRLSEGGTLPSVLQEVSVPIVSNDKCHSMFLRAGRQEFIPDIFLCAGHETGGQDSCQGDSGGPLQAKAQDGRFFLAGIISWGIGCAEANLPGVCTRISKFVPWILEHVR